MRILVGMSGGLDSSYAAMKLMEEGHSVEGAYLVMHEHASPDPAVDAAQRLGIPLHVIDCRTAFDEVVRENFVSEYKRGRTPNPCVICNPGVKFSALAEYARSNGFDRISTGHYARVLQRGTDGCTRHVLAKASDVAKDQSYMLYRLPEDVLSMLVLPLGDECKANIRQHIRGSEFSSFDRKDSQEICFIPDGNYAEYIEERAGKSLHGPFVDADGRTVGEHKGIIRYTVGQRKGLGISLGERAFITEIDAENNLIRVEPAPKLSSRAMLEKVTLSGLAAYNGEFSCDVKIRYAARPTPARVVLHTDACAEVLFDHPQRSVTPGQSAVFYDGELLIGGGIICK